MNFRKYMKLVVLSLTMVMVFAGCSAEKVDNSDMGENVEVSTGISTEETASDSPAVETENLEGEIAIEDIMESVGDLFEGEVPSIIISDETEFDEIEKDTFFAIALDENPSTGYIWRIKENDKIEVVGNGFIDVQTDKPLVGAGGTRYYGIKSLVDGEISIEFELIAPSGDVEESTTFNLISK